jgi:hypothetical protein
MPRKRLKHNFCANCNFEFSAQSEHTNYCPNCGQENHNPRFPLIHYVYELLESFLHFDTKFLHSIKVLVFKPGQITKDYIQNIRGRYTPPFRMFIFISIFALIVTARFEKFLFASGFFGKYNPEGKESTTTIGEMFDHSIDSVKDVILVAPFSWILNNPEVTNGDLKKLKKISKDSVGFWLSEFGYDNNLLTRFYALNKKLRISRDMTIPEVTTMVVSIFKWLYLIMIPVFAGICFLIFYRKNLLFYDTMLYSIHISGFFLILQSFFLLEILFFAFLKMKILPYIGLINLVLLFLYLFISLKKVFDFHWLNTFVRMMVAFLLTFTVYQLIHYTISFNSGR